MTDLIHLHSDTLQYNGIKLFNPHHVTITNGVNVVIGANGAGKSSFARILEKGWNFMTNRITSPIGKMRIKCIEFADIHSLSGFKAEYYQQRYESMMNDEVPTVAELMKERIDTQRWQHLCELLSLNGIEEKRVNFLSSGELRKLLIINTMFDLPDLLILDNPYIGLDSTSRQVLNDTIRQIAGDGITVMLILCNTSDIPSYTDVLIPIHNSVIEKPISYQTITESEKLEISKMFDYNIDLTQLPDKPDTETLNADIIFALNRCKVRYGSITILNDVSWTVKTDECWSLTGANGSGKSTLLSLVHADNPQGYSNDITLFDRRRGSGESIWDIKRHIGYISPEMHHYFNGSGDVTTIIAQGLNDTVGLFKKLKDWQIAQAKCWMQLLHIDHLSTRLFNTLSAGEQRLVLLARTLIKHPQLLILDEPLHGLDEARKRSIRTLINHLTKRDKLSLIYVTHYLPEIPDCVTHHFTLKRVI